MKTSLDHLPERKQRDIETIATLLQDEFDRYIQNKNGRKASYRILKIILFGSHAKGTWVNNPLNGYISDYDILVIVNHENLVEDYSFWMPVEERIQRRIQAPLSLIVHSMSDVSERLHQGHYFFKDIREEGIELYSSSKKELATPGNLGAEEQKRIAEEHYGQWFESAAIFYIQYQNALKIPEHKNAAFQLHQATERFYACNLLVHTNYLPRTHNIERLCSLCAQIDARHIDIFPRTSRFNRRCFQRLKRAYIEARYSKHYEITEEELNWLAEEVKKLQALTEESCRARIGSF